MKKMNWSGKHDYLFKNVLLILSGIVFALLVSCGGGGGGGSSDIDDDSNVDVDAVLWSYEAGWDIGNADPLTFDISRQEGTVNVTINGFRVTGNYNLETDEVTLLNGNWFNVNAEETGYGELDITIVESVSWVMSGHPEAGAFRVLMEDETEISLTANANVDGAGTAGVDIVSGDQSVSLTWDEFEEIPDLSFDDDYRHIANFGYKVWVFIYERIYYTFKTLITVTDHEAELESAGSGNVGYVQSCDMFPPTGGETGTRQFLYEDVSGNSALGPGDNFKLILDSCWIEGGRDDEGVIINGELELNGYIENVSADDELISLGFVDVNFVNFVEQPVEENAGVYSLSTSGIITTNGQYSLWLRPAVASDITTFPLLKTGQLVSYDENGNINAAILDDGRWQYGSDFSYVENGDGSVTDQVTDLRWMQHGSDTELTYSGAQSYCSAVTIDGGGWRIPNVYEYYTILNFSLGNPALDHTFSSSLSGVYWTSTPMAGFSTLVWSIREPYADDVVFNRIDNENTNYVRCVKGEELEPPETGRFTDNGSGTVLDSWTRLIWEAASDDNGAVGHTWEEALSYCEAKTTLGREWHLPNAKQMQSLLSKDEAEPAIDTGFFTNDSYTLWTSTTDIYTNSGDNDLAWAASEGSYGEFVLAGIFKTSSIDDSSQPMGVRCVSW